MKLCLGQNFGSSGQRVAWPILPVYSYHTLHLLSHNPKPDTHPTRTSIRSIILIWAWAWAWVDMRRGRAGYEYGGVCESWVHVCMIEQIKIDKLLYHTPTGPTHILPIFTTQIRILPYSKSYSIHPFAALLYLTFTKAFSLPYP